MKPSEEFINLRHRFSRVIEMQLAYQTFNLEQVNAGGDNVLQTNIQIRQITHSLLVAFYSYLYSLFDKPREAISFIDVLNDIKKNNPSATELISIGEIVEGEWSKIEPNIRDLRHKIGFHFSKSFKGSKYGYDQFENIHPLTPYIILDGLRFFFRTSLKYYEFEESYISKPVDSDFHEYINYLNDNIKKRDSVKFV
jgi:hypothetical protein